MKQLLNHFPYLSVKQTYFLFRLCLAGLFMAHASLRFFEPNYFHQFGDYLERRHVPFAYIIPYLATAIEMVGGPLLIFNHYAKWVALLFFSISFGGIIIIHFALGWFVGEWGTGGCEYSVALCMMCLMVAAMDREQQDQRTALQTPTLPSS